MTKHSATRSLKLLDYTQKSPKGATSVRKGKIPLWNEDLITYLHEITPKKFAGQSFVTTTDSSKKRSDASMEKLLHESKGLAALDFYSRVVA